MVNVDATIRLFAEDDSWELALIGKNLTDELRVTWAAESPFSFGIDETGNPANADLIGNTNAPRTFMLRLTVKWGDH